MIYKEYKIAKFKSTENNTFKKQLWENLYCEGIQSTSARNTDYNEQDLLKYFTMYNSLCRGQESTALVKDKKTHDAINITFRPGASFSSMKIVNAVVQSRKVDFGLNISPRIGLEFEYILPFNRGKWSAFIEPTYQHYKTEEKDIVYAQSTLETFTTQTFADYKSIEVPIGLRHYFFLNSSSKLFLDAAFAFDFPMNSKVGFTTSDVEDIEILTSSPYLITGLGYNLNDKYIVQLRYNMARSISKETFFWKSDYRSFSVIFGYNLF